MPVDGLDGRALRATALVLLGAALMLAAQSAAPPTAAPPGAGGAAELKQLHSGGCQALGGGHAAAAAADAAAPPPPFVDPSGTCPDYAAYVPQFRKWLRWWRRGSVTSDNVTALLFGTYDSYGAVPDPQMLREQFIAQSRVQLVGGRAHFMRNPVGYDYKARAPDVALQLVALLPWAAARGIALPDVDVVYNVHDAPVFQTSIPLPAPTHAMSTSPIHADVPIPDMSFREWPQENGMGAEQSMNYSELIAHVLAAGDPAVRPYAGRTRRAVFRGSVNEAYAERHAAALVAAAHPELLDFAGAPLSLAEHAQYAVVLAIPGNGWMARLKYSLASGSPVVVLQAGLENGLWEEWFYHRMTPFVHYWPIRHVGELKSAVAYLLDHPARAAAIGAAGRAFVATQLGEEQVRCYWAYYLTYLSSVFVPGSVAVHPWAVEVVTDSHEAFDPIYFGEWFLDKPPLLGGGRR